MGIDIGIGVFGSDPYGYLGAQVFCFRPPRFISALGNIIPSDLVRRDTFQIKTPKEIAKSVMEDILKPWHSCEIGIKLLDARQKIPVTIKVYEREGRPLKNWRILLPCGR